MSSKEQHRFLSLFETLLASGFSLLEALNFLDKLPSVKQEEVRVIRESFQAGENLARGFEKLNFPKAVVVQLEFAEIHGDLLSTLASMKQYQKTKAEQQQKLVKIASYPALLLIFLFVLLIALRQYLLPQLQENLMLSSSWSVKFIEYGPYGILVFLGVLGGTILILKLFLSRKSSLYRATFYAKLPFFGKLYQFYLTSYISREWGRLFQQGLELKDIVQIMKQLTTYPLLTELSEQMERELQNGYSFHEQVESWAFVNDEFGVMVRQGEVKARLGEELLIYSQLIWKMMLEKVEKAMQWIQPLVFLFVALMIVSIYGALLLPIYSNMGEVIK
jgi:competence protein ComGB